MNFEDVNIVNAMLYGGIDRNETTYRLSGRALGNTTLDDGIEWLGDIANKPSDNQVITWETERLAEIDNENEITDSRNGLKEKISLAQAFHSEIKTVFNAILEETETQTVQPARYNTLRALMDSQSGTFKNRFNTDLLQEARIDESNITTDTQRSTYCLYLRTWITGLVILLALT